jgi:hypothetical protein
MFQSGSPAFLPGFLLVDALLQQSGKLHFPKRAGTTTNISGCSRWQLDGHGKNAALGKHKTLSTFPPPRRLSLNKIPPKV